jgi:hypothetical protein
MKIINEKPLIYDRLHKAFGVEWDKGLIIAYGGNIHFNGSFLPLAKIAHEEVHFTQQMMMNQDEWWEKYITDKEFRLRMEVEAYRAEVKWINKTIKDRNLKFQMINDIAITLSSSVYGCIITRSEALKLIK